MKKLVSYNDLPLQSAPQIMTECNRLSEADLETQLNSLSEQLTSYENKSAEYEGNFFLNSLIILEKMT